MSAVYIGSVCTGHRECNLLCCSDAKAGGQKPKSSKVIELKAAGITLGKFGRNVTLEPSAVNWAQEEYTDKAWRSPTCFAEVKVRSSAVLYERNGLEWGTT